MSVIPNNNNATARDCTHGKDLFMTKEQIKKLAINQMVDDIKDYEKHGVFGEDLWDSINIYDYSNSLTEKDKIKAFQIAGYEVYQ